MSDDRIYVAPEDVSALMCARDSDELALDRLVADVNDRFTPTESHLNAARNEHVEALDEFERVSKHVSTCTREELEQFALKCWRAQRQHETTLSLIRGGNLSLKAAAFVAETALDGLGVVRVVTTPPSSNPVRLWVEQCCEVLAESTAASKGSTVSMLYPSYKKWSHRTGQPSMARRQFSDSLGAVVQRRRTKLARVYMVKLRCEVAT